MSASDLWQSKRNNYVVVCYVQMLMITDYSHTESVDKLIKKTKQNTTLVMHTWSSTVISVPNVLSVFHFSVKVKPYSDFLYFVSRLPATLPVSVLEEPAVLNSYKTNNCVQTITFIKNTDL